MSDYPTVAYFCMEYGLHPSLTIYSGGLGILAGDTMKSIGDLRRPVIGIGLFWGEGYTTQLIGENGVPEDHYLPTSRDALSPVGVQIEVEVGGKTVPCQAYQVTQHVESTLYLLEPVAAEDRWITHRLYGGGAEDRLAQEILLGVGGVRLLQALGIEPEVYHFNEGHAVFAGLELVRQRRDAGTPVKEAIAQVKERIVFTTHTPVKAGNEVHPLDLMVRMNANCGLEQADLIDIGGTPFNMTVAGLRLARKANAVAELHGETARDMWKDVSGAAPIVAITNGVHVPTWQDARVRAATVVDKDAATQKRELFRAHQEMKRELIASIAERTGVHFDADKLLIGFARRKATYKRADLIFGDEARLDALVKDRGLQLVFSGKAHPADQAGKAMVERIVAASKRWPANVVFLENYEMTLGALLTRGADVWLNNPRRPFEASGTSGMKAAMNGVLNMSILDGWWPEGCRHGETGWRIGEGTDSSVDISDAEKQAQDERDRAALFDVLEREVVPTYYDERDKWIEMMVASVAMSRWRFSSDRMVEDYFRVLYATE